MTSSVQIQIQIPVAKRSSKLIIMPFYRRRFYRRRFYRRYRKYSRGFKKVKAASSLKQVSLPIRKTLSVNFTVSGSSFVSDVITLSAMPRPGYSDSTALIAGNTPFSSLADVFDQVRIQNFGIQLTPALSSGFPPGALLICPDRKWNASSKGVETVSAENLLSSPSTQVVGFTQFSTLQTRRSLYASTTVERQSFTDTYNLDGSLLEFSPAFYLVVRLAAAPAQAQTIPCTVTLTGTLVFRNPSN